MSRRSAAVFTCLALSAPALVACGHSPTSTDAAGTIKAITSTIQICDYIAQFANGGVSSDLSFDRTEADGKTQHFGADAARTKFHFKLTCLLAPDASVREYDMITAQSKAPSEADLFFILGVDLEHFLDSAADSTGFKGTMMVTSGAAGTVGIDDLAVQEKKEEAKLYKVDRDSVRVRVAKWSFPPEESESEPEFHFDPHVWTSPRNVVVQVTNIDAALEKAAPDQAGVFHSHVDAYAAKLEKFDGWVASLLGSVPQDERVLFASHDAFGYFGKELGVKFEGAALSDLSAQQDATADRIQQIADKVKSSEAMVIFAENFDNPESIQKVAEVAEVKVVISDEAPYGDSLGTSGPDGEAYIDSIPHDVSNLIEAWGGMTIEIPANLVQWTPKASGVK